MCGPLVRLTKSSVSRCLQRLRTCFGGRAPSELPPSPGPPDTDGANVGCVGEMGIAIVPHLPTTPFLVLSPSIPFNTLQEVHMTAGGSHAEIPWSLLLGLTQTWRIDTVNSDSMENTPHLEGQCIEACLEGFKQQLLFGGWGVLRRDMVAG